MSSRISRRLFLAGAAGFAAGVPITLLADRLLAPRFSGTTKEDPKPEYAMPGPFPGRVVEVHRADAVSPEYVVNQSAVGDMLDEGMTRLTGADSGDVKAAWGRFFQRGDVVGVKVNPVGRAAKPGEAATSPAPSPPSPAMPSSSKSFIGSRTPASCRRTSSSSSATPRSSSTPAMRIWWSANYPRSAGPPRRCATATRRWT